MNKKKRINFRRLFVNILLGIVSFILSVILAFNILIIGGASPTLQSIWISTAMTTFHHQYLATWFFSPEKIEAVMGAETVEDDGLSSDMLDFSDKKKPLETGDPDSGENNTDPEPTNKPDTYLEEGYKLLEEGIYLKEVKGKNWTGFLMLITDPFRVKLVQTSRQWVCGETVMTMVNNNDCVAGINAGGFSDGVEFNSNGGVPAGLLIVDGKLVCPQKADGTTYHKMTGFTKDGALLLSHCTDTWALENEMVGAVSIFPFLIVNGESTVKKGTGGWGMHPRTAIAQRATGEVIFFVVDGRQLYSLGCDLKDLIDVLLEEKCVNASMMDGGASTAMVYDGKYVNKPCLGHERRINNAWVVTKIDKGN